MKIRDLLSKKSPSYKKTELFVAPAVVIPGVLPAVAKVLGQIIIGIYAARGMYEALPYVMFKMHMSEPEARAYLEKIMVEIPPFLREDAMRMGQEIAANHPGARAEDIARMLETQLAMDTAGTMGEAFREIHREPTVEEDTTFVSPWRDRFGGRE